MTESQKGSLILVVELLARALADNDRSNVRLAQLQLASTFGKPWAALEPDLIEEIVAALEGDSNDAEHDALVSVAQTFQLGWAEPS